MTGLLLSSLEGGRVSTVVHWNGTLMRTRSVPLAAVLVREVLAGPDAGVPSDRAGGPATPGPEVFE